MDYLASVVRLGEEAGISRHFMDRIGGLPRHGHVQFGAIKQAKRIKELRHLYRTRSFVSSFSWLSSRVQEAIAYIGTPSHDQDYMRILEDHDKPNRMGRSGMGLATNYVNASITPILLSGMSIAL